jgi:transcriptional regulator with PAS, ATPase and Fis domain
MAVRKDDNDSRVPIIGECPSLLKAVRAVEKAAEFAYLSVLVTGESGTGKEIAARKYHAATKRQGLFISVNCAAIPDSLVATELIGAERGAYTGADRVRQGVFELANGGTLFLDEIGDASPELQKALLRIIEDQAFRRVGGSKSIKVDVRIIAATNKDLGKMLLRCESIVTS